MIKIPEVIKEKFGIKEEPELDPFIPYQDRMALKRLLHALWKYMLDHARIENDGTIVIRISIRDKADFLKKINSRIYGQYQAVDFTKIEFISNFYRRNYDARKRWRTFYRFGWPKLLWLWILRKVGAFTNRQRIAIDYPYVLTKKGKNPAEEIEAIYNSIKNKV